MNTKQRGIYSEFFLNTKNQENENRNAQKNGPKPEHFISFTYDKSKMCYPQKSGSDGSQNGLLDKKTGSSQNLKASGPQPFSFTGLQTFYNKHISNLKEIKLQNQTNFNVLNLEPKVMESYNPIPGRVPRKIIIERKRIQFSSFDFDNFLGKSLLLDLLRFFDSSKNYNWINFEAFEDTTYDDYSVDEWLSKIKAEIKDYNPDSKNSLAIINMNVKVNALWQKGQNVQIKKAMIEYYDANTKDFYGYWIDSKTELKLKRIFFCFESENPNTWLVKLEKAAQLKYLSIVKLKYNFIIDRMNNEDLNPMDPEQKQRLITQSGLSDKYKGFEPDEYIEDSQYQRTINKIIFDQYCHGIAKKFPIEDIIKYKNEKKQRKKKLVTENLLNKKRGFIEILNKRENETTNLKDDVYEVCKPQAFGEIFKEFCFSSLFIKEEAIEALQQIKASCEHIKSLRFFTFKIEGGVKRLDEFKTIQESSISQTVSFLKNTWIKKLIDIIKGKFSSVGKGWFNMKETNRLTYEFGKLKRFLTVVRLSMQDALKELLMKSLIELVDYFKMRIPESISIISQSQVENVYSNNMISTPIISLDLVQVVNKEEFNYLFKPDKICSDILELFEKAIDELKKIPDLEPKILETLHKAKKTETYVITPVLPKEMPEIPDPSIIPKRYPDENQWLWDLYVDFSHTLKGATRPLEDFKKTFKVYEPTLALKPEEAMAKFNKEEGGTDIESLKIALQRWKLEEQKLKTTISEEIQISCFSINCKEALRVLLGKYQEIGKKQIEELVKNLKECSKAIQKKWSDIEKELLKQPNTIEEMTKMREFINGQLSKNLDELRLDIDGWIAISDLLEAQKYKLSKDDFNKRWKLLSGPKEILKIVKEREKTWDRLTVKFSEQMSHDQEEFAEDIARMESTVSDFYHYHNLTDFEEIGNLVEKINEKLEEMIVTSKTFNKRESLLEKQELTDYSKIQKLSKGFNPFMVFWKTISYWMKNLPKWNHDPIEIIDAFSAEKFIEEDYKNFNSVIKSFKDKSKAGEDEKYHKIISLGEGIQNEIDDFKKKVPILVALKKEGMNDRHWEELQLRTGINFEKNDSLTFASLIKQNIMNYASICIEVGEKASRECDIEKSMNKMKMEWEAIDFQIQKFKETGSFVITNFEKIEGVLDQHLTDTQTLLINPFKKPFTEQIDEWYENLLLVSNILEEWKRFQGQWCYLQPIFDSPDINKQLPNESAMFKRIDINWRQTMSQTRIQKNVLKICTSEGYLDKFKDSNMSLDRIQKELRTYLELKRAKFGRFYFLSNDDLLSILSETKDVEKVQDHLRKVFENIAKLTFDPDKKIIAMNSVENETVNFGKFTVDPSMRQVEDWMSDVESSMMNSVREHFLSAIKSYTSLPRTQWICHPPGQCVLNGSQVHWTSETETAIQSSDLIGYIERLEQQLRDLVLIDRSQLTKNLFVTLEALIVIDVHAKDVVEKLLKSNTTSIFDFEWISQLRYYWTNNNVIVQCLQTEYPYGYEYLGNTPRLVITPLTDKCYMTLMSAIKLNLGGAPAGPAGTGKTESTKDLAKALAKQCVVFNCQESMDYNFVAKFFKGLASSGAWCCFDEFNRINLEVLSVIAQQLQELFRAKAEKLTTVKFEGSEIKLKEGFSVFITMNPGYAGRTELPDNLKALFRSVAMMVPDYALIAEIKLYSFGFTKARELARKMVATFKLSSEQLSSQYHYDYGMRAVTSVINAAGLLKKQSLDTVSEDVLLLRSIKDVNLPKFLKDDLPLFQNIVRDLFPTTSEPVYDYTKLLPKIHQAASMMNLQSANGFITKILELYNTTLVRHGLMLVGPAGGGKTSAYKVLQKAITLAAQEFPEDYSKINVEFINPKSLSMVQLYGEYREMNWNEGIIELVFEKAIKNQFEADKANEKYWIMFDGPVDALWIESMNTVLDDNKKLCLSSGKVLIMSSLMTIMFEVEDLKEASPATVSRCGMVYMEPDNIGLDSLLSSFISEISSEVNLSKSFSSIILSTTESITKPMLQYIRNNCKEICPTTNVNLLKSFCNLAKCLIMDNEEHLVIPTSDKKEKIPDADLKAMTEQIKSRLVNLIIFCSIWSIGCTVDHESRVQLNLQLHDLLRQLNITFSLQPNQNVYDYKLDVKSNQFVDWLSGINILKPDNATKTNFTDIIVPTIDSTRMIYIAQTLLKHNNHILTPGPVGTGKTTNVYTLLTQNLSDDFISTSIAFSAQTNEAQVMEMIFSQLVKKKRGIYGPPTGKRIVVFIDDLNMPKKEKYGAQPPIELLRELIDHKYWYVWKLNKEHLKIEDVLLLGAMGPAGGGRTEISQRFNRHFNILSYTDLDQKIIFSIFSTILNQQLKNYHEFIRHSIDSLISSTFKIYYKVKTDLLPIPAKSHYQFNLRDISRVFAGICSSSPNVITNVEDLLDIWAHENFRVFHDRLINIEDRKYFCNQVKEAITQNFSSYAHHYEDCFSKFSFGHQRVIYYADPNQEGIHHNMYKKVTNISEFVSNFYEVQKSLNRECPSGKPKISLVFFLDACEHIAKITRVLRQPQGNMLLLGVGGSGKQSLTRLAAFICDHYPFTIEVTKGYNIPKWREDIKRLVYMSVTETNPITFILPDTQIISEQFVEDISCLLNTGTISNLPFNADELKKLETILKADCSAQGLIPNKINMLQMQIQRLKKNSHVVFCMSPLSNKFATRLRMFPALISCCTIDWFLEWPEEALINVATEFIQKIEDTRDFVCETSVLVKYFSAAHQMVEKENNQFRLDLNRKNFITPTSYLELLKTFGTILEFKSHENIQALNRLENGVTKLKEANLDVERLQEQLLKEEPELKRTEEEVRNMLEKITEDKHNADKKKEIVAKEEINAKKAQEEAATIAAKVKMEVDEADKELAKTLEKIGLLNQGHLNEIKSFDKPPEKVKYVFMATCVLMLDISTLSIKSAWTDEETEQFFWKTAKSDLLKDPQFLSKLQSIDFSKVEANKIKKIRELVVDHSKRSKTWIEVEMQKSNIANYCLFLLVNAVLRFNELYEKTKPLRKQHDDVMEELKKKEAFLEEKNKELAVINSKLMQLESLLEEKNKEISELRLKIEGCTQKLERAKKLTDLLSEENSRWYEEIKNLKETGQLTEGNCALSSVMLNYAGPFPSAYRTTIENKAISLLQLLCIPYLDKITMRKYLGSEIKAQQWHLYGLPKDDCSLENAIIMENSNRWSYLIDPQKQGFNFLKNSMHSNKDMLEIIKNGSSNIFKILEQSLMLGKWLIIENCPAVIDPLLEPIINKHITKIGGNLQIMLGDRFVSYCDKFKLILTTDMQNPDFTPETCSKISIVNFSITESGLEEQMLGVIVQLENQQLEHQKNDIVKRNADDKSTLLILEDDILKTLSESKNDFLENSNLITKLASSKKTATEIKLRVADSKITEEKIDEARESYRSLAKRVSLLFFIASSLSNLDYLYEFSLEWFNKLFKESVNNTKENLNFQQRLHTLTQNFTYDLYISICRSIFERHKLIFVFMIAIAILEKSGEIGSDEIKLLFSVSFPDAPSQPLNPTSYISETTWKSFYKLVNAISQLKRFNHFDQFFLKHSETFKQIYLSATPENESLPSLYVDTKYPNDNFAMLLMIKLLRPDKMLLAVEKFVNQNLGPSYTEFKAPLLADIFVKSTQTTPLVIIFASGTDPKSEIDKLAEKEGIREILSISLGQGQGHKVEKMINDASKSGSWILLQNCHLAESFMPNLEQIISSFSGLVHPDFRLWMTTAPTTIIPISILQVSHRITIEPPKGLKSNLQKSYATIDEKEFDEQNETYKKLLYGLCFFHAVAQNRRNYGAIGWNIPYQFTLEDLQVSQKMLEMYLSEYKQVPFKVLNFVFSEINYGGRVTDNNDLRLIKSLMQVYICPEVLKRNYSFSESGRFLCPEDLDYKGYLEFIQALPANTSPEVFFLHDNAEIITNENVTREFFESLLNIKSTQNKSSDNNQDALSSLVEDLITRSPSMFDYNAVVAKYPVEYTESMNTVLTQEIMRYNRLIEIYQANLKELQKALKGEVGFSDELEEIVQSISIGQVPQLWQYPLGFLSLKPLGSWLDEFLARINFLNKWIRNGKPKVFWFSGFFFPQAFITGTLQNYSRKHNIAIDRLSFNYKIQDKLIESSITTPPADGVYINGLYLEGASWDYGHHLLADPKPKELYSLLPIVELVPVADSQENNVGVYRCPLYKVLSRAGSLSTTGHSTNFIMYLDVPTNEKEDTWVRKGVASFLALRY